MVLDQTLLPDREVWVDGGDPAAMAQHIRVLRVRGAPLIGVAAAMSVAWFAEHGAAEGDVRTAAARLRAARPTAVNLMAAIDRVLNAVASHFDADALVAEAEAIAAEDVALCRGDGGARRAPDRGRQWRPHALQHGRLGYCRSGDRAGCCPARGRERQTASCLRG